MHDCINYKDTLFYYKKVDLPQIDLKFDILMIINIKHVHIRTGDMFYVSERETFYRGAKTQIGTIFAIILKKKF